MQQDEVRPYCEDYDPAPLFSPDRSRRLNPREIVRVLLDAAGPLLADHLEYVHAVARRDLPAAIR